MKITMSVPASRVNEAMELALKAKDVSCFEEAYEFADNLGGYQDYGGTCGDAEHIGDFLGGAISGYICEKSEIEELDGEQVEFTVEGTHKEVR